MIEIDAENSLSQDKAGPVKATGVYSVFCLLKSPPCGGDIDKCMAHFSRCRDIRRFGKLPVPFFVPPDDPAVKPGKICRDILIPITYLQKINPTKKRWCQKNSWYTGQFFEDFAIVQIIPLLVGISDSKRTAAADIEADQVIRKQRNHPGS